MLRLQSFEPNDFGTLISWIVNKEFLMQFAGPTFTFPLTEEQLADSIADKKRYCYKLINNELMAGYGEIYLSDHSAYLGRLLIGNKKDRGKGMGLKLVQGLLRKAFIEMNQTYVALNVFDWNICAIRCYEKAGFVLEPGKLLERYINQERWIAVHMTLHRNKWEQLNTLPSI